MTQDLTGLLELGRRIEQTLDALDDQLDALDAQIVAFADRLDALDGRVESLAERLDRFARRDDGIYGPSTSNAATPSTCSSCGAENPIAGLLCVACARTALDGATLEALGDLMARPKAKP